MEGVQSYGMLATKKKTTKRDENGLEPPKCKYINGV